MHWDDFKAQAPELAARGEDRFQRAGVILLGTLRRNGYPRISPVEPLIVHGKLYLGMMWQSRKALDLLRDPRCTVNNLVANKDDSQQFKLFGRAEEVNDPREREQYAVEMAAHLGIDMSAFDDFHLFAIDLETASYAEVRGEEWYREFWSADGSPPLPALSS